MIASAKIEAAISDAALPLRSGVFVAVVGPSGAGKDTIINFARKRLAGSGVTFVRRVITRPNDGSSEDHDSLTAEAFERAAARGEFAFWWRAHGLSYGLPASVDQVMRDGQVAIANMSRGAIPALRQRYANVTVVEITARPEILAQRLAKRGRESAEEVSARLDRTVCSDYSEGAVVIDNSSSPDLAGEQFLSHLRRALAAADIGDTV